MKKIFILIFCFFLASCSSNKVQNQNKNDYNFSSLLSLEEFKIRLKEYAINNPYPNIDD